MNSIFQVLTLAFTLQGGQYFNNAENNSGIYSINNNYFFETSFEFQLPLSWAKGDKNNFFIGAETENQFFPNPLRSFQFNPWQDTYTFNTGLRLWGVEVGYKHQCTHPVVFNQYEKTSAIARAYDKFYAQVSGTF